MGLTDYYRRFMMNYEKIIELLTCLFKKMHFCGVMKLHIVLTLLDFSKLFIVEINA